MISSISNLSNLSNNKSALQIINLALSKMKTQAAENEDNEASDIYTYSNPDLAYFAWLALVDENKGDYALGLHSKSALLKLALKQVDKTDIPQLLSGISTPVITYQPKNLDTMPDSYNSDGNVKPNEEKGGMYNTFM